MKKLFFLFMVAGGVAVTTTGCSKESIATNNDESAMMANGTTTKNISATAVNAAGEEVVSVTIPMNTQYQRDLGFFGREEYAEITQQAQHYAISQVTRQNDNLIYTYFPQKNYTGTDEVLIQLNKDSDGTQAHNVSYLRIMITVQDVKQPQ